MPPLEERRNKNMARLNILKLGGLFGAPLQTHEGAPARAVSPELALRRSVLACLLWESQFYEDGVEIAGRIQELVPRVAASQVAALAVEAREKMKLRHAPLLLVREMARHKTHRADVAQTLARVIQRADELAEFVALYWKDGRKPLSAQVKKGLASAFTKFDEYALAKYDRAQPVKLRDVLFLCHAKPRDEAQAQLWKRLVSGELATPDTWEVALSSGADKRAAWERLIRERGTRSRRASLHEHGARAAIPLSGGGALRARVGGSAGGGDARFCALAGEAAWQDRAAGGRFRQHDGAALPPLGDAAHRRGLRSRHPAA